MPIHIKTSEPKGINSVLLPFSKDKMDMPVIRKFSGLDYDPEINTGAREITCFHHPQKKLRVFVLSLGESKDQPRSYTFYRSLVHQQRVKGALKLAVHCNHLNDDQLTNAIIGLRKGLLNIGTFKTNGNKFTEPDITIILESKRIANAKEALEVVEAQLGIMHLVDLPSNIKTPTFIADYAKNSGKKHGYDVKVFQLRELKKMKMEALMAVGQGSANPPVLIVMEYKPKGIRTKAPKLGLVGKGISFDTGGISIKPSANMGYMKSDMAGAAAVIGAIELAARLRLNIHVVGVVPSAENSVDAYSIRPGDVISSYSGKSIEVLDTDAEGRLVLADGLAYIIKNYGPEYLIDLATLTGSCVATLGYTAAGLFTHNDSMAADLSKAGEAVHERVWRLPLFEDYMADMQSDIADIKNLSGKPVAGASTAAKFLEFFTSEHKKWAHLDIAGVAFTDSEYAKTRTATAYGVRLLTGFMKSLK